MSARPTAGIVSRTPAEKWVAKIWTQVLKIEPLSIFDDFFALGGHSLLATRVQFRLREELCVEISLADFFRRPTLAAMAEAVEEAAPSAEPLDVIRAAPALTAADTDDLFNDLEELCEEELLELLGEEERRPRG